MLIYIKIYNTCYQQLHVCFEELDVALYLQCLCCSRNEDALACTQGCCVALVVGDCAFAFQADGDNEAVEL